MPGPPPPGSKLVNAGQPSELNAAAPGPQGGRREGPTRAGHVAAVLAVVTPVTVADLKEAVAGVATAQAVVGSSGVELALKISQAHP